jgi:hypothetical protein
VEGVTNIEVLRPSLPMERRCARPGPLRANATIEVLTSVVDKLLSTKMLVLRVEGLG